MGNFIPDLLMCWASYAEPGMLSELKHQQETVCRTLGSDFKVGKESDDTIAFWDSIHGISVLFAKDHFIISTQLPNDDAKQEKWQAFVETAGHVLSLSSVPEKFSTFVCNARSFYATSEDVDESMDHVEKIVRALSHGRPIVVLLDTEITDRQGVDEVIYRTVQNTQNQLYGLSLIYSRSAADDIELDKDSVNIFLQEENVIQQILDEQKRLDELAQIAIKPTET